MITNLCMNLHPVLEKFVRDVFPFNDKEYQIVDWDSKRIYIDAENEEFTIRMWNASMFEIDYSINKIIGDHGKGIKSGIYIISHENKRRLP